MIFILLLGFSALFVAGCAAFFSIKGLVVLFSGSALAIGIMASSLEIGKLVAASFLHRYWHEISFLLKTYLSIAVAVLVLITSMGIFGFLTNAYQMHAATVSTFETGITTLETERDALNKTSEELATRVKSLTEIRITQEQRVQEAGNYRTPREQAYKAIETANAEITQKEQQISEVRNKLIDVEKRIADIKIQMSTKTDIGSFKFIADALGTDVDTAVKIFILTLVFVFDPLAVSLVLALNVLLEKRKEEKRSKTKQIKTKAANTEPTIIPDEVSPSIQPEVITEAFASPVEDYAELKKLYNEGKISEKEYLRKIAGTNDSIITL
jgi:hypothetical protein